MGEYVIVYYVEGEDVFILRIVHGRRDFDRLFELCRGVGGEDRHPPKDATSDLRIRQSNHIFYEAV